MSLCWVPGEPPASLSESQGRVQGRSSAVGRVAPSPGPGAVLAHLSRPTHRVAIANRQLIAPDDKGVTFRWKDYPAKDRQRRKTMTLAPGVFIRRVPIHLLPTRFHRWSRCASLKNMISRSYCLYGSGG